MWSVVYETTGRLLEESQCIWESGKFTPYLWVVFVGGLAMAWMGFGIGANDVANQFSSSIGSRAVSLWLAIILAFVFEFLGAFLLGGTVADSVRSGILDIDALADAPAIVMYGNMCALIGAATWLQISSRAGLPVSTTHSIIGALIGVGISSGNASAVRWGKVGEIVGSWLASPILAAAMSILIFSFTRWAVLRRQNPVKVGLRGLWCLVFVVSIVFTLFFVFKNSWAIGSLTCTDSDGNVEEPCTLKHWASANPGPAIGVSLAFAAVLTLLLCPLVYFYALRSLKEYDARSDREAKACIKKEKEKSAIKSDEADGDVDAECEVIEADEVSDHAPRDPDAIKVTSHKLPESEDSTNVDETVTHSASAWQWCKDRWSKAPWFRDLHKEAMEEDPIAAELTNISEKFDSRVECLFRTCQVISASMGCLAHGANDVANAVAPFATVLSIYELCMVSSVSSVPAYVLAMGGLCISLGLAVYGYNVIKTMGCKMVQISPSRGYSIELGAAVTVVVFSQFGIPLSTTHCQVGATLGVGLMERGAEYGFTPKLSNCGIFNWHAVNWKLMGKVFLSWMLTLVCASLMTMLVFAGGVYGPSIWSNNPGGGGQNDLPVR